MHRYKTLKRRGKYRDGRVCKKVFCEQNSCVCLQQKQTCMDRLDHGVSYILPIAGFFHTPFKMIYRLVSTFFYLFLGQSQEKTTLENCGGIMSRHRRVAV